MISNHSNANESNLVNRYGFPEGVGYGGYSGVHGGGHGGYGGGGAEERRGPYIYLLAQVKSVHFEEDAQYYTVRRENDGKEQRADAGE